MNEQSSLDIVERLLTLAKILPEQRSIFREVAAEIIRLHYASGVIQSPVGWGSHLPGKIEL